MPDTTKMTKEETNRVYIREIESQIERTKNLIEFGGNDPDSYNCGWLNGQLITLQRVLFMLKEA